MIRLISTFLFIFTCGFTSISYSNDEGIDFLSNSEDLKAGRCTIRRVLVKPKEPLPRTHLGLGVSSFESSFTFKDGEKTREYRDLESRISRVLFSKGYQFGYLPVRTQSDSVHTTNFPYGDMNLSLWYSEAANDRGELVRASIVPHTNTLVNRSYGNKIPLQIDTIDNLTWQEELYSADVLDGLLALPTCAEFIESLKSRNTRVENGSHGESKYEFSQQ